MTHAEARLMTDKDAKLLASIDRLSRDTLVIARISVRIAALALVIELTRLSMGR